jgi:hypothetical protein
MLDVFQLDDVSVRQTVLDQAHELQGLKDTVRA